MSTKDRLISAVIVGSAVDMSAVQAGDIGVAHSTGIIGRIIRVLTRSKWNHAFVVTAVGPTPETTTVIQAQAKGVVEAKLSDVAPGGSYAILPCPSGVDRTRVVSEAQALLRRKYGFVSIFSVLFNLGVPLIRLEVHEGSTLICSAVVALALFGAGWDHQWPDLYSVTPAQIALALAVTASA